MYNHESAEENVQNLFEELEVHLCRNHGMCDGNFFLSGIEGTNVGVAVVQL